eukprot:4206172-Amphidinium_carterae.3
MIVQEPVLEVQWALGWLLVEAMSVSSTEACRLASCQSCLQSTVIDSGFLASECEVSVAAAVSNLD